MRENKEKNNDFEEKVLEVNRITRVVKGGRRLRFRVAVVVGNKKGQVGFGLAKGNEVQTAFEKAKLQAKKHLITVPMKEATIPHLVEMKFNATKIILKPAAKGTSIIAGSTVRTILILAGIEDIISKTIGSSSKINSAQATILCLKSLTV